MPMLSSITWIEIGRFKFNSLTRCEISYPFSAVIICYMTDIYCGVY